MQEVKYSKVTKADLMSLFGIGEIKFERWKKSGLPGPNESDGRFSLSKVIRWREKLYAAKLSRILTPDRLSQKQLAEMFGITRQTINAWGRNGLPRRADKRYELSKVCHWLRTYYHAIASREYERRLSSIRRKLKRNVSQLEKFLETKN